jgi:signal recognition particle subunit SRP54
MFGALTEKFSQVFSSLRSKGRITEDDIVKTAGELRTALLEADVAIEVVEEFVEVVSKKSLELLSELSRSTNPANQITEVISAQLQEILGGDSSKISFAKKPPTIILLSGLQGAGKTTLAAKLANFYKKSGNTPLLVACDLQRPNAVNQLKIVAEQAAIPVFAPEPGNGVGDPVEVAKASIRFAEEKLHNMVIVDTAGRLGVDEEMMDQAARIRDAISPHEILFVVDAMTGQDAARSAKAFKSAVGIDGVVLTKLDGDAKGGAALSVAKVSGKPIRFVSTGEKLEDFDLFYPERMASRILGAGDLATLAESAKRAFDGATAARLEEKFASGDDFTLEDFLEQLKAMRKMGSMTKLLSMLPGAQTKDMRKQLDSLDDKELVRTQAIIDSMTPAERRDIKILNGSRRARIARGSGRSVSEVNNLVDRFSAAQKVMKQMRSGGTPQVPGMPVIPGSTKPAVVAPKKKSRSGNPAKRAAEER